MTALEVELWDAIREAERQASPNAAYEVLRTIMEKHGVSSGSPTDEHLWNERIKAPFTQDGFDGRCFDCGSYEADGHTDKCAVKHGPFPPLGEPKVSK